MKKKAFTMIELMYVIVIIGILASVAIPKFTGIREQADIASARADISSIRSSIMGERQTQLIQGVNTYIPRLTSATTDPILFGGDGTRALLKYGIATGGKWENSANTGTTDTYTCTINSIEVTFRYYNSTYATDITQRGIFTCDPTTEPTQPEKDLCESLVN